MRTAWVFVMCILQAPAFAQRDTQACSHLQSLSTPQMTISAAEPVPAGPFTAPGPARPGQTGQLWLPARCRVSATLKPTTDSNIEIEVWMPAANWNGKMQSVGNGGWSGAINTGGMAQALLQGYATASTDTGHKGGRGSFALGHPEKLIDFGYRAVHEMTVAAKKVISAYYGSAPRHSYWNGCSSGGKQGLKEAQRYPTDYDGIVAGAPANYWTHLMAADLWIGVAALKDKESFIPPEKYRLINQAVLAACDEVDGLKDGLLNDPRQCHFDISKLLCSGAGTSACLTAPQSKRRKRSMPQRPTRVPQRSSIRACNRVANWRGRQSPVVHNRSAFPLIISNSWCMRTPIGTGEPSTWIVIPRWRMKKIKAH